MSDDNHTVDTQRRHVQPDASDKVVMGLSGVWQLIAQLGATGLICFLFYVQFRANMEQAVIDRQMYQQQIGAFLKEANAAHVEAVKSKIAIEANTAAIRDLSFEIRKTRLEKLN